MVSDDFRQQWEKDFRLTTAEIFYFMPDFPDLLQVYLWQDLDLSPDFPKLKKFLAFWEQHLEGRLHSVDVAHCGQIQPVKLKVYAAELVVAG